MWSDVAQEFDRRVGAVSEVNGSVEIEVTEGRRWVKENVQQ